MSADHIINVGVSLFVSSTSPCVNLPTIMKVSGGTNNRKLRKIVSDNWAVRRLLLRSADQLAIS